MKKYTLTGGIIGLIVGIIISIYSANQSSCIGSSLKYIDQNGVPVIGSTCPEVNVLANLQSSILLELGILVVLIIIGVLIGWIIGKIAMRRRGTTMN